MWDEIKEVKSATLSVSKFVYTKKDAVAESVLYKYPTYEERTVICCSTQSGCPVGCRFCGAGDNFVRSLSAEEIVSQPMHLLSITGVPATQIKKLQIMFMSMGEPMLNQRELIRAIKALYVLYPQAALLISTSGPAVDYAGIIQTAVEVPKVGLQFSVHESSEEARNALIPYKNKLPLYEISLRGTEFFLKTGRQPFFNYCVHDKNNTDADVARLRKLFHPNVWQATISVICERTEHMAAANERQRTLAHDFMNKMMKEGYSVRMFDPAGQDDVGGGCGQLWFVQSWMKSHPGLTRRSAGHGLPEVHTPTENH